MAENKKNQKEEAPIHGDVLEAIMSHVPLIDLAPASQVSRAWKRTVSTSLRHPKARLKPWLIFYVRNTTDPYSAKTGYAYDPRSNMWIQIENLRSIESFSTLRSPHSTLLDLLSPSHFYFSLDPLHLTWHQADSPFVSRIDPIVAVVGHYVIVAGGACDFEYNPLAVEIYCARTRSWEACERMPEIFKYSTSSIWVSVAVDSTRMFVVEKSSGVMYWFDTCTRKWCGPCNLHDGNLYCCCIEFVNGRLILVGIVGEGENVKRMNVWEVYGECMEKLRKIGEIKEEMVERMMINSGENFKVGVIITGDLVYVFNHSKPEELFLFEIGSDDGVIGLGSVKNVAMDEIGLMARLVIGYSNVGLTDLQRALTSMSVKLHRLY